MTTTSVKVGTSKKNTHCLAMVKGENDANLKSLAQEETVTRDPSLELKNHLQESSINHGQGYSPPPQEETRDEENESTGHDSFVYSDDSASLSDAYFSPQIDDIPPRYRNDPLQHLNFQYPLASYYGSIDRSAPTRLWVGGSIQETEEMQAADLPKMGNVRVFRKERRRRRRKQRSFREQRLLVATTCMTGQPIGENVRCNDWFWAILFVAQLLLVLFSGIYTLLVFLPEFYQMQIYMPWHEKLRTSSLSYSSATGEMQYTDDALAPPGALDRTIESGAAVTIEFANALVIICISGTLSCWIASLSLTLMLVLSQSLFYIVLIFSVFLALIWTIVGLSFDPYGVITIMGFSVFLFTMGYTIFNWNRVPFAAANLTTAMSALRCTSFVTIILGLSSLGLTFSWCIVWCMASLGAVDFVSSINNHEKENGDLVNKGIAISLYSFLVLSFYWTTTVIQNITKVTIASVVGTWWFLPGDIKFWDPKTVLRPLSHSLVYRLGSISLGSIALPLANLFAAIGKCTDVFDKAHHDSSESTHRTNRSTPLRKTTEQYSDSMVLEKSAPSGCSPRWFSVGDRWNISFQSCNHWSYVFIGMYGCSFAEAGQRALQLFETHEWLEAAKDRFVENALLIASLIIGGSSGTLTVVMMQSMDDDQILSLRLPVVSAFLIGSVLGYVLSNILLLGIVGSAVDTVFVCFGTNPFEFERNRPDLSRKMRIGWVGVYGPPA